MPFTLDAAKSIALISRIDTLLAEVIPTDEKLLFESKVILLLVPEAVNVVAPETFKIPLSVIAPVVVVTVKAPVTVELPKSNAFASVTEAFLPDNNIVPKLLALFNVISFVAPTAVKVANPVMFNAADCKIEPLPVVAVNVPKAVIAGSVKLVLAPSYNNVTLRNVPLVPAKESAPGAVVLFLKEKSRTLEAGAPIEMAPLIIFACVLRIISEATVFAINETAPLPV